MIGLEQLSMSSGNKLREFEINEISNQFIFKISVMN